MNESSVLSKVRITQGIKNSVVVMSAMLLYMGNILDSVDDAAIVAWRLMENLKCQATEFSFSFMVVKNCWGFLRGKLYDYSCMKALWRMDWRGK